MQENSIEIFDWSENTILIGEDEHINFRLLEVMLAKTRVKILRGKNGLETFKLFQANPQIDLILMDIKMPEMDGCEVTREIRKINKSIPIIAQTAYALEEEKEKSLEAGCTAYITKPINKKDLLLLIEEKIHKNINNAI
jgi:CheY-like chemotaxis protein